MLLRKICLNLCESVDNPSPLSRFRVIRVIRGHTLWLSGLLLNVSFLFCEEFGGLNIFQIVVNSDDADMNGV